LGQTANSPPLASCHLEHPTRVLRDKAGMNKRRDLVMMESPRDREGDRLRIGA